MTAGSREGGAPKRARSPANLLWEHALELLRAEGVDVDALQTALSTHVRTGEDGWWGRGDGPVALQLGAEWLANVTGNERIGLRLGERQPRGAQGVFDYLLETAPTLRDSLAISHAFSPLVFDYVRTELREEPPIAWLRMVPPAGLVLHPVVVDYRLVRAWRGIARFVEPDGPCAIELAYAEPRSLEPYRAALGPHARLRFGQQATAVGFPSAWLDRRRPHDAEMHAILHEHAERLLARLRQSEGSFLTRVEATLIHELHAGRPTIERIARRLCTSARTLRRRLAEEGTTYQAIVDRVRASLAELYLSDASVSSDQVAERLGFESGRAFRRALRRWTARSVREHPAPP